MTTDGGGSAGTGNGLRWLASSRRITSKGGASVDGQMSRYQKGWDRLHATC
jgi:hypothetical protein